MFQYVNPVTHGNARGLPVAVRGSNASIGQTVARLVVADPPLHEALIELPFRPSGSSVDWRAKTRTQLEGGNKDAASIVFHADIGVAPLKQSSPASQAGYINRHPRGHRRGPFEA